MYTRDASARSKRVKRTFPGQSAGRRKFPKANENANAERPRGEQFPSDNDEVCGKFYWIARRDNFAGASGGGFRTKPEYRLARDIPRSSGMPCMRRIVREANETRRSIGAPIFNRISLSGSGCSSQTRIATLDRRFDSACIRCARS